MEPGRQRAEAWLADLTRVQREADRDAQQAAQLGAGAEIAGQDSRGCQPEMIAAQGGSGAARACACACPWQPIETAPGLPVLVSRPNDSRYFYTPTTAYRDAIGVWRLFRSSPGGMQRLPFTPTHWMPLPDPPVLP